jgi:hypothetical protein
MFAGVSDQNIADDGYGRVVAYGVASAAVNGGGNSVLSLNGQGVGPANGTWSLSSTGFPSDATGAAVSAAPLVALLDTTLSGEGATKNVFVRAL